jgi:hypothetical protein
MKTMTVRSLAFGVLLLAGSVSFVNASTTDSKEVKITPVENLNLGKSAEKVWNINYSEQEKPVTITMHQVGNSKEYVARSEFFEVAYVLNKRGFGVSMTSHSLKSVPEQINSTVLNYEQLKKQRTLTKSQVSDEVALQMIADYLPELLNERYKHLIY